LKLHDQSNAASYFVRQLSGTWLVECKTRAWPGASSSTMKHILSRARRTE
jgi:hypothetical protein